VPHDGKGFVRVFGCCCAACNSSSATCAYSSLDVAGSLCHDCYDSYESEQASQAHDAVSGTTVHSVGGCKRLKVCGSLM
jgi:hypothetical protein